MATITCPNEERFGGDLVGCGQTFEQSDESIADDPDGWVDCPNCGLGFHPVGGVV